MLTLFLISSLSWSIGTSVIGDKVLLPTAESYHFSDPNLVEVHLENDPRFFIGLQEGSFHYEAGSKKTEHFILNSQQNQFFKKTNPLISKTTLNWSMDQKTLFIKGDTTSDTLYNYLLEV